MEKIREYVENEPLFCSKVLAYSEAIKHNLNQVLNVVFISLNRNLKTPNQTKTKTTKLKAGKLAIPAFLIVVFLARYKVCMTRFNYKTKAVTAFKVVQGLLSY